MTDKLKTIIFPIIFTIGILLIGFCLPELLLERQRKSVTAEEVSVPCEEIHPYGEWINENDSLEGNILSMEVLHHLIDDGAVIIKEEIWSNEQDEVYHQGITRLLDFLMSWDRNIWKRINEGMDSEYSLVYDPVTYENLAGILELHDEALGISNTVIFDLKTGIPIYAQLYVADISAENLWMKLGATLSERLNITFQYQNMNMPEDLDSYEYGDDAVVDIAMSSDSDENYIRYVMKSEDENLVITGMIEYFDSYAVLQFELD